MPHFELDTQQTLSVPGESYDKRDEELDQLRNELKRLKEQLRITAAERDHLRAQTTRQDEKEELLRRQSPDGHKEARKSQFLSTTGQALARRISDPRIGRPKKILVIGGGPAGLISLHELLSPFNRPQNEPLNQYHIQLYERRADVGGVWYFEKENEIAKGWHHGETGLKSKEQGRLAKKLSKASTYSAGDMEMLDLGWSTSDGDQDEDELQKPQTNGHSRKAKASNSITNGALLNDLTSTQTSSKASDNFCWLTHPHHAPRWPSPAYEGLVGNVLRPLLEFSAQRFPKPKDGLFPSMVETHEYLTRLAEPIHSHIKTNMEVVSVKPIYSSDVEKPITWAVTSIDWSTEGHSEPFTEEWDCVVTAAGAFDHPYYPTESIPSLEPLLAAKSPLVMHAKTYSGPRPFLNQHNKIVVVGNANSANDIAAHLAPLNSSGPLYRCIRHESNFAHLPDSRIQDVAPIADINVSFDRATLSLTLTDGMQIDGVTKLIFASGYQYEFPWISVPSIANDDKSTTKDCANAVPASLHGAVPYLHNVTFHAAAPTLSFIGLSQNSTPMPTAEIQARTVARTYFGLMLLPPTTEDMLSSFRARAETLNLNEADPKGWRALHHIRGEPERVLTETLLDELEKSEPGSSAGLFRWDEWREHIAKTMRATKEAELRRLRNNKVAAGGVDGGIGGVLSFGPTVGQRFNPVYGERKAAVSSTNGGSGGVIWGRGGGGV